VLADRSGVGRPGEAQGPPERPTPLRKIEAAEVGVHVRTATGEAATRIRNKAVAIRARVATDCHDS